MKIAMGLIVFLIFGGAAAFWLANAIPVDTVESPKAPSDMAAGGTSLRMVRAIGFVEPASEIRKLTFDVDGIIETLPVTLGQEVEAGDILATLRSRDEQAAVAVAEIELAVAKAECAKLLSGAHPSELEATEHRITRLKERIRHAQTQHQRQANLLEKNAATHEAFDLANTKLLQSIADLLESQAFLNQLKTQVREEDRALAEVRIQLAEATVAAAKEQYCNTILSAPIRGTVLEILKRTGEAVRTFDPQPVIIFADMSQLRVRAEVDERYAGLICIGQVATIYGPGLGQKRLKGKVVLCKSLMGNKTVFSREATERKDLDVLQVFIEPMDSLNVPVGLQVDVEIVPESARGR